MVGAAKQSSLMSKKKTKLTGPERRAARKRESLPLKIGAAKEKASTHMAASERKIGSATKKRAVRQERYGKKIERLEERRQKVIARAGKVDTRHVKRIQAREKRAKKISEWDAKRMEKLHRQRAEQLGEAAKLTNEASAISEALATQAESLKNIDEQIASLRSMRPTKRVGDQHKALVGWKKDLTKSMGKNQKMLVKKEKQLTTLGFPRGEYYAEVEDLRGRQEMDRKTKKAVKKSKNTS